MHAPARSMQPSGNCALSYLVENHKSTLDNRIAASLALLRLPAWIVREVRADRVLALFERDTNMLGNDAQTLHIYYFDQPTKLRSRLIASYRLKEKATLALSEHGAMFNLESKDFRIELSALRARRVYYGSAWPLVAGLHYNARLKDLLLRGYGPNTDGSINITEIQIDRIPRSGIVTTSIIGDDALYSGLLKQGVPRDLMVQLEARRMISVENIGSMGHLVRGDSIIITYCGNMATVWDGISRISQVPTFTPSTAWPKRRSWDSRVNKSRSVDNFWVTLHDSFGLVDPLEADYVTLPPLGCKSRLEKVEARSPGHLLQIHLTRLETGMVPMSLDRQQFPWRWLKK
jgi:hypothetical protein